MILLLFDPIRVRMVVGHCIIPQFHWGLRTINTFGVLNKEFDIQRVAMALCTVSNVLLINVLNFGQRIML